MAAAQLPHAQTADNGHGARPFISCITRSSARWAFLFVVLISLTALYYHSSASDGNSPAVLGATSLWAKDGTGEPDYLLDYTYDTLVADQSAAGKRSRRLPDAIIMGARKCGTRALLQYLSLHPAIAARRGREVHYFDNDRRYERGPRWYAKQMPLAADGQLIVEKTPAYFHESGVPGRVAQLLPNAKLILVVRDPVVRSVSDYTQLAVARRFRGRQYDTFENVVLTRDGRVNGRNYVVRIGRYAEHMDNWLAHFPLAQVHVVDGEMFKHRPWVELYKVEHFLNVTHVLDMTKFYYSAAKGFYCPVVNGDVKCLGPSKGRQHPDVDPAVLNKLAHYYRPINDRFCDLVARNFSWCHLALD